MSRLLMVILVFFFCFRQEALAQLSIDFSVDRAGGCSPLVVHFTSSVGGAGGGGAGGGGTGGDSGGGSGIGGGGSGGGTGGSSGGGTGGGGSGGTTGGGTGGGDSTGGGTGGSGSGGGTGGGTGGAGGGLVYNWDLGNGNSSSAAAPAAVYTSVGTYTITLTVSNGGAVATAVHTVTVYAPPAVSFSAGSDKVCGTAVSYTAGTDAANGGSIVGWLWDFGDGTVSSAGPAITHSYSQTGAAGASLTVTDNHGCTATLSQPGIVQVYPELVAGFTSDKSVLCTVADPVAFTNTSTGPGTLSYAWDFGDGSVSAAANANHVYSTAGTYGVRLTVTSSIGCSATFIQSTPLNVASYHSDFSFPSAAVCAGSVVNFTDLSTPAATSREWEVDGAGAGVWDPWSYQFSAPGTHTITLANLFGTCPQQVSKTITVNPNPPATPFSVATSPGCNSYGVTLTDQSTGSFTRSWNQNYYATGSPGFVPGNGPQMSFSGFAYNSYYTAALTLTSAAGCSTTITEPVYLAQATPVIYETSGAPEASCNQPLTKSFAVNYPGTLQGFSWDFGDGTTATGSTPTHTFSQPGVYNTVLHYVDANGCSGVTEALQTIIDAPLSLDFTASPTTVCVGSTVNFSVSGTGGGTTVFYNWDFGDNTASASPYHTYTTPGTYTVRLAAASGGGCQAVVSKTAYITVLAAPGSYQGHSNSCDNRVLVTFDYASTAASTVTWDFGDGQGTSSNGATAQVQHTYAATGTYYINVSASNGVCTVQNSDIVHVLTKQQPVLTAGAATVCVNGSLDVQLAIARDPAVVSSSLYYDYTPQFYYADGTPFGGTVTFTNSYQPYSNGAFGWTLSGFAAGESGLYVVTTSFGLGCTDRSNTIPLTFTGTARAGLTVVSDDHCYQAPVTFADGSVNAFTETWDFGDGMTQAVAPSSPHGMVSHTYSDPGQYIVSVTATDAGGCQTTSATAVVDVNGPKAAFNTSGNTILSGNTLYLYNTTNVYGAASVAYSWDFGDGGTSALYAPSHLYASPGTYTVTLTATSPAAGGCTSSVSQVITVKPFNSHFAISTSYVTKGACPPVLAQFTNTSQGYSSVSWDFGDGGTAGNVNDPFHVYISTGTYTVTLSVYGTGGLIAQYTDVVNVRQPSGVLATSTPGVCLGSAAFLQASAKGASSFVFDYGDGSVVSGADADVSHIYSAAGTYSASLVVKDTVGCAVAVTPAVSVTVHPLPVIHVSPASPVACLYGSVGLSASGAATYSWTPASGLDRVDGASPVASPLVSTVYSVTGIDDNGCTGVGTVAVKVVLPETMTVSPDSVSVCAGSAVGLTASGADVYAWIYDTSGLSNVDAGKVLARPLASLHYTVVGSDSYGCFYDTASVAVTVLPVPSVDAGSTVEVLAGTPVSLAATGSPDIVSWQWTPPDYLSCTDCAEPVCTPKKPEVYTLAVVNDVGCTASDTVSVKLICAAERVRIPEAFSPNGDGRNDRFDILGIGEVDHLVIFDRWGEKVFERSHFYTADAGSQWDGTVHGQPAPVGTYVYFVEMTCPTGGAFMRRGTVVLVR